MCCVQEEEKSDNEDGPRKVGFLVEEDETERHDRLKRTNTPHYTKGKRLYTDKEDVQQQFHEIMARVAANEDNSDEQRVSLALCFHSEF